MTIRARSRGFPLIVCCAIVCYGCVAESPSQGAAAVPRASGAGECRRRGATRVVNKSTGRGGAAERKKRNKSVGARGVPGASTKTAVKTSWGLELVKPGFDRCHFANWSKLLFDTQKGSFDSRIPHARLEKLKRLWKKAKRDWVRGKGMSDARQKLWRAHRHVAARHLLDAPFLKKTIIFLIGFSKWTNDWDEPKGDFSEHGNLHTTRMCDDPLVVDPSGSLVPTPLDRSTFNKLVGVEKTRISDDRAAAQLAFMFANLAAWRAPVIHDPAAFAPQIKKWTRQDPRDLKPPIVRQTSRSESFVVSFHTLGGTSFTSLSGLHSWIVEIARDGEITKMSCTKLP